MGGLAVIMKAGRGKRVEGVRDGRKEERDR